MKNKNKILLILGIVCVLLAGVVVFTMLKDKEKAEKTISSKTSNSESDSITYNGKKYKKNSDIKTMLFIGVDKESKAELHNSPGENGQSDSLNLLIMNQKTNEAQVLQISRECMVEIDIYGEDGTKLMSSEGQIALQYAYGDGEEKSCRLTSEKVSGLLFGTNINSYLSLTLEGMVVATDAIGGVTLTIPEDYTAIDPAFVQGETITLDGGLAEKYVRTRDIEVLDSNNQRMERQAQFMNALIKEMQEIGGTMKYAEIYQELEPYMISNMTADELKEISEYKISSDMLKIPGEIIEKDGHAQYIVDNDKLQEMIINLFYKQV